MKREKALTRMNLRRWYGTSLRIPQQGKHGYVEFLVSSIGIVRSIVQKETGKRIKVAFHSGGTAWADQDKGLISINRNFLDGRFRRDVWAESEQTISAILGIIVHESAHFAWSPPKATEWSEYIRKNTTRTYNDAIAKTLGNITEDIFIEAEVGRNVPSLSWMLDECNEVFFTEKDWEDALKKVALIDSAPENFEDLNNALNFLIFAKTRDEAPVQPFLSDLFNLALSAAETTTLTERLDLDLAIYNRLMEKFTKAENGESDEQEEGEGDGGEGEEGAGSSSGESGEGSSKKSAGKLTEEQLDKLAKTLAKSEGITAKHGEEAPSKTFSESSAVNRMLESYEEYEITYEEGESGKTGNLYVEKPLEKRTPVQIDERYIQLAEVGRQRATVNRPYGLDMNRGHNIRKLHRIATDGKIFAQPVIMNNYKPMQVIILVDCSGSMTHGVKRGGESRIAAALKATAGAAIGLAAARCEVAVYGHTADIEGYGSVVIYTAKTFNEPIDVVAPRLGSIGNHMLSQNRDGNAVYYVAKKFTASQKRRLLIVISDGDPLAAGYNGYAAWEHTKRAVEAARAKGIDVLSISITDEANHANSRIYGEKWNIFNEDVNVIESVVASLLG